ncbi:MAG: DUF975 family protein [Oscillospiraceae bacterium]|nr:DUF975 family protein [Oscillospiraceae bacterium]
MSPTLRDIKRQARSLLFRSKAKPAPILVALLFAVLMTAVSFFQTDISGATMRVDEAQMAEFSARAQQGDMPGFAEFTEAIEIDTPEVTGFSSVLNVALQGLTILLGAGFSLYALHLIRTPETAEIGNLLDGFGRFYRVVMIYLLRSILVGLGLMCFIVPGVLMFYSFRQAEYLLWDHPDWGPFRCLQASRLLMYGRRGKLFILDLSFILLIYLSSLPLSLASYCLQQKMYAALAGVLVLGCAFLAFFYLYFEVTNALWYNCCLMTKKNESEEYPSWEK